MIETIEVIDMIDMIDMIETIDQEDLGIYFNLDIWTVIELINIKKKDVVSNVTRGVIVPWNVETTKNSTIFD